MTRAAPPRRLEPLHLEPVGPYDARRLVAFVAAHAVPGVEAWDGTTYARTLRLPSGPGVVELTPVGTGVEARLALTDPADETVALSQVRHLLDLDHDVSDAERALSDDELLGPLVAARPGLRLPGSVDHPETLVRTVIGQQVSLAGARTVTARLAAAHGAALSSSWLGVVPGLTHTFPCPRALAGLDGSDPALAMPRSRARAVVAAARAVVDVGGALPARADLLAVPGVGPWTADYVDLRCHREPDVFLATDLAVRRALERAGVDGSPRGAGLAALAWAPYRSLALMHLWAGYLAL